MREKQGKYNSSCKKYEYVPNLVNSMEILAERQVKQRIIMKTGKFREVEPEASIFLFLTEH